MEIKKGQKLENYSIISKDTLSCVCVCFHRLMQLLLDELPLSPDQLL